MVLAMGQRCGFVKGLGFPLDEGEGPFGAVPEAGSQAVAQAIPDNTGLAVHDG